MRVALALDAPSARQALHPASRRLHANPRPLDSIALGPKATAHQNRDTIYTQYAQPKEPRPHFTAEASGPTVLCFVTRMLDTLSTTGSALSKQQCSTP